MYIPKVNIERVDGGAETTDLLGRDLNEKDWGDNRGETDADTGDGTSDEKHGIVTAASGPEGAAEEHETTRNLSTANSTEALADRVADDSAENGEELHHGGDVGLLVALGWDVEVLLEGLLRDHATDETLVDTARGTEETHAGDGKGQTPVERRLGRLREVSELGRDVHGEEGGEGVS